MQHALLRIERVKTMIEEGQSEEASHARRRIGNIMDCDRHMPRFGPIEPDGIRLSRLSLNWPSCWLGCDAEEARATERPAVWRDRLGEDRMSLSDAVERHVQPCSNDGQVSCLFIFNRNRARCLRSLESESGRLEASLTGQPLGRNPAEDRRNWQSRWASTGQVVPDCRS